MPVLAESRRIGRELRTALTGVDPGLGRLRLATTATAAMLLAAGVMEAIRVATGQAVTVLILSAFLAMISNLAVTEPDLPDRRVTTALMFVAAAASITASVLLTPWRIAADVMFVLVTAGAVYVRRYGPRGFALGMAAFMSYFFTQFLGARPAELPWLLVAAAVGIGSTLLLAGWLFAERPERTLDRLLRAFRARLHALVEAVGDVLADDTAPEDVEDALSGVRLARARLNDTALLVADRVEHLGAAADRVDEDLSLEVLDAELAAERLAVSTRRLLLEDEPLDPLVRRTLIAGIASLGRATATGTATERVPALLDSARRSVAALAAATPEGSGRAQRVAFAVGRLADALQVARRSAGIEAPSAPAGSAAAAAGPTVPGPATSGQTGAQRAAAEPTGPEPTGAAQPDTGQHATGQAASERDGPELHDDRDSDEGGSAEPEPDRELPLAARQAVQVGVATSLAIILGELVSPARWYWAVIAAFVVFAGTSSRGDVLNRGSQRVVGTVGGVAAGMGLAALVGDHRVLSVVLLFVCVFLAVYLARISQALMAFWITAVLALLYGLTGQFSTDTLVLRIVETTVGAALGKLAGYLVLPNRTRTAFVEALDVTTDAADATLAATVDRITGREPQTPPLELARDLDEALATLRARVKPLSGPVSRWRGRSGYERTVRVLTAVDHYARGLARFSDTLVAPGWEPTLRPAVDRVRTNLDRLRTVLHDDPAQDREPIESAEELVDAAEAAAARTPGHRLRAEQLDAVRLLRRIDQAVGGFAADLGAAADPADTRADGTPIRG